MHVTKRSIFVKNTTVLAILTFTLLIGVMLLVNKSTTVWNNSSGISQSTSNATARKLEGVKYTLKQTENGQILSSSNYNFEVVFPSYYEDFSLGGGFNKDFPENATTSVGGKHRLDPSDKDNFMSYAISISFLNNESIQMITNNDVENIKRSLIEGGKTEKDGQIQLQKVATQAGEFIKIRYIDAFNFESISYYIPYKDKYYTIFVGQTRKTRLSQTQLNEINQVVKSFKFF